MTSWLPDIPDDVFFQGLFSSSTSPEVLAGLIGRGLLTPDQLQRLPPPENPHDPPLWAQWLLQAQAEAPLGGSVSAEFTPLSRMSPEQQREVPLVDRLGVWLVQHLAPEQLAISEVAWSRLITPRLCQTLTALMEHHPTIPEMMYFWAQKAIAESSLPLLGVWKQVGGLEKLRGPYRWKLLVENTMSPAMVEALLPMGILNGGFDALDWDKLPETWLARIAWRSPEEKLEALNTEAEKIEALAQYLARPPASSQPHPARLGEAVELARREVARLRLRWDPPRNLRHAREQRERWPADGYLGRQRLLPTSYVWENMRESCKSEIWVNLLLRDFPEALLDSDDGLGATARDRLWALAIITQPKGLPEDWQDRDPGATDPEAVLSRLERLANAKHPEPPPHDPSFPPEFNIQRKKEVYGIAHRLLTTWSGVAPQGHSWWGAVPLGEPAAVQAQLQQRLGPVATWSDSVAWLWKASASEAMPLVRLLRALAPWVKTMGNDIVASGPKWQPLLQAWVAQAALQPLPRRQALADALVPLLQTAFLHPFGTRASAEEKQAKRLWLQPCYANPMELANALLSATEQQGPPVPEGLRDITWAKAFGEQYPAVLWVGALRALELQGATVDWAGLLPATPSENPCLATVLEEPWRAAVLQARLPGTETAPRPRL